MRQTCEARLSVLSISFSLWLLGNSGYGVIFASSYCVVFIMRLAKILPLAPNYSVLSLYCIFPVSEDSNVLLLSLEKSPLKTPSWGHQRLDWDGWGLRISLISLPDSLFWHLNPKTVFCWWPPYACHKLSFILFISCWVSAFIDNATAYIIFALCQIKLASSNIKAAHFSTNSASIVLLPQLNWEKGEMIHLQVKTPR